jgi:hypothetical protein
VIRNPEKKSWMFEKNEYGNRGLKPTKKMDYLKSEKARKK